MKNVHKIILVAGLTIGSMILAGCQSAPVSTNNISPVTGEPQVTIDATSSSGKAGRLTVTQEPITDGKAETVTPNIDLSAVSNDSAPVVTE